MEYIETYGIWLATEKGASCNTRDAYLCDLRRFDAWLTDLGGHLERATPAQLHRYIRHLEREGRSAATIARSSASLRSFYGFLAGKGSISSNPAKNLCGSKAEHKPPQILTSEEVESFLSQPDGSAPKDIRDRAMLELLYATGIRVSELIDLNVKDIDLTHGTVRCQHGGKMRTIPLYRAALRQLSAYVRNVRASLLSDAQEEALFVNLSGTRMSRQGFWKIVKDYQEKAGISKEITPSILRHSFAAHLLERGTDLKALQQMLGHASPASTRIYAGISPQKAPVLNQESHTNF